MLCRRLAGNGSLAKIVQTKRLQVPNSALWEEQDSQPVCHKDRMPNQKLPKLHHVEWLHVHHVHPLVTIYHQPPFLVQHPGQRSGHRTRHWHWTLTSPNQMLPGPRPWSAWRVSWFPSPEWPGPFLVRAVWFWSVDSTLMTPKNQTFKRIQTMFMVQTSISGFHVPLSMRLKSMAGMFWCVPQWWQRVPIRQLLWSDNVDCIACQQVLAYWMGQVLIFGYFWCLQMSKTHLMYNVIDFVLMTDHPVNLYCL